MTKVTKEGNSLAAACPSFAVPAARIIRAGWMYTVRTDGCPGKLLEELEFHVPGLDLNVARPGGCAARFAPVLIKMICALVFALMT